MNRVIIILSICISITSCGSKDICEKHYAFDFPTTVTPQDTFHIGDTIWYEMNLPNQLLDKNSGEYINFTNYELSFRISADKVDTNFTYEAMHLFDIYTDIGTIVQNIGQFTYTYIDFKSINEKHFKFGLIPKRKGCYAFGLSLDMDIYHKESDYYDRLQITNTECREFMYEKSGVRINNGNVNYYLVDGVCQLTNDNVEICYDPYEHFSSRGGFAFVVD